MTAEEKRKVLGLVERRLKRHERSRDNDTELWYVRQIKAGEATAILVALRRLLGDTDA